MTLGWRRRRWTRPLAAAGLHQFVWGIEDNHEISREHHGLVDPRLQTFVRVMLDDMLSKG